jgi:hypothetical protein
MGLKPAMKENIVRLLRTTEGRVNIKARTHEKVSSALLIAVIQTGDGFLSIAALSYCRSIALERVAHTHATSLSFSRSCK